MKDFLVVLGAYKEESEGQIKELKEAVERFRMPRLYANAEIKDLDVTFLAQTPGAACLGNNEKLVFLSKDRNEDLVSAARLLLALDARGVVLLFGNNENRDYIKEGAAYKAKEVRAFCEELLRLAPLFNRRLV